MSLLGNYKHSASSGNKIVNAPQAFIAEKIFKIKSGYGDSAKRGNVAEPMGYYILAKDPTKEQAIDYATKKWKKIGGVSDDELKFAIGCGFRMADELQSMQLARPDKYQERVFGKGADFGLKRDIHGFLDFSYFKKVPKPIVTDIKTTKRVPSSLETCNYDHILQQALYWKLTGENRQFALLYVSDKKTNYLLIPEAKLKEAWEIMKFNLQLIERLDEKCKSKADWLLSFPYPDLSSFYFSDKEFKQQIINLYKGVIENE
jgi:hypothetical protein